MKYQGSFTFWLKPIEFFIIYNGLKPVPIDILLIDNKISLPLLWFHSPDNSLQYSLFHQDLGST